MEKPNANRMMTREDVLEKNVPSGMTEYLFPEHGLVIVAASIEEAEAELKKLIKENKQ